MFQRAFGLSARVILEIDIRIPYIHIQRARELILLCETPTSPCGLSCRKACHSSVHQTVQNYTLYLCIRIKIVPIKPNCFNARVTSVPSSTPAFSLKYCEPPPSFKKISRTQTTTRWPARRNILVPEYYISIPIDDNIAE